MPRKTKSKRSKTKERTKISQKVIQKVIVKVGEERRAKKARRKQRRISKEQEQELFLQQQIQDRVAPNVIYQTAAPFQAPRQQPTITDAVKEVKPSYLEIEPKPLEFIGEKTKKELLSEFITPVPQEESITSQLFSQQLLPQQKVDGNYAFGKPDNATDQAPTALLDIETKFTKPTFSFYETVVKNKPITLSESYLERPPTEESMYEAESEQPFLKISKKIEKKPKRSSQEVAIQRRNELQNLLKLEGMSNDKAFQIAQQYQPKELPDEIRKQKYVLKQRKIKIPKSK